MLDATNPESPEHESIIVPKEASQLFGAYLRQEFEGPLEAIGKPQNQRLVDFINDLETSKEVKLVEKDGISDFDFSKEKDRASTANSFTMNIDITSRFLSAVDHNVRNALGLLIRFDEQIPLEMADVLTALSKAKELEMSRDENGKIKIISLAKRLAT